MALEDVIVAIYGHDKDEPVGGGFLVDDSLVITCAHVVNRALDHEKYSTGRPVGEIKVRLFDSQSSDYIAVIDPFGDSWSDPPARGQIGADLCVLRLQDATRREIGSNLLSDILRARLPLKFRVAGFPSNWDVDYATGEIVGRDTNGLYLLRSAPVGAGIGRNSIKIFGKNPRPAGLIHEGFSGCPVEVDERIVGLIAETRIDFDDSTAYMIPVRAFPSRISYSASPYDPRPLHVPLPQLQLTLVDPKSLQVTIPAIRDKSKDMAELLAAELAAHGLPTRDWVAKVWARTKANSGGPELIDDLKEYADQVAEWMRATLMGLAYRHSYETYMARRFFLAFKLSNVGSLPANNLKLELFLPSTLTVNDGSSSNDESGWFPTKMPVPPKSWKPPEGIPTKVGPRPSFLPLPRGKGVWYADLAEPAKSNVSAIHMLKSRDNSDPNTQMLYCRLENFQHGDSLPLELIEVSFGRSHDPKPSHNVEISYKIHADNQPVDIKGNICISVTEPGAPSAK
jgi:hypothetical protein